MKLKDLFKSKKIIKTETTTVIETTIKTGTSEVTDKEEKKPFETVAPKEIGILDMVIAIGYCCLLW